MEGSSDRVTNVHNNESVVRISMGWVRGHTRVMWRFMWSFDWCGIIWTRWPVSQRVHNWTTYLMRGKVDRVIWRTFCKLRGEIIAVEFLLVQNYFVANVVLPLNLWPKKTTSFSKITNSGTHDHNALQMHLDTKQDIIEGELIIRTATN